MKFTTLLVILLSTVAPQLSAQNLRTDLSETFNEEIYKIVQTGSGSTMIVAATKAEGLKVRVYDRDHKLKAAPIYNEERISEVIKETIWPIALISNDNSASFFVEYKVGKQQKLHRFTISDADGKLTSDEDVAETGPDGTYDHYGYGLNENGPHYKLVKDCKSNDYSVIIFKGSADNPSTPIELVHYDGNTFKATGKGGYEYKASRMNPIIIRGTVTDGSKAVYMCTETGSGKGISLNISVLVNGEMKHYPLKLPGNKIPLNIKMTFNPATNSLIILAATDKRIVSSKEIYNLWMLSLDPQTLEVKSSRLINQSMIDGYRKRHFGAEKPFGGFLEEVYVKQDGTVTIISRDSYLMIPGGTTLYDIGVLDVDTSGRTIGAYSVPAPQLSGYFHYRYIPSTFGHYIVYNAHPDDFDRDLSKNPKMMPAFSDANAAGFYLHGDSLDRFYLLGTPDNTFKNRAMFASADYNEQTAEFPVIILDRKSIRDKPVRVAWVHFK